MQFKFNRHLPFIKPFEGNFFLNGQFSRTESLEKIPSNKLFKWMLTPNPLRKEKRLDKWRPEVMERKDFITASENQIVWLGHASFFIKIGRYKILTDPVFYDLAPLMKRRHPLPCSASIFENIDYIILSHGHRDHLDIPSLKKLSKQNPNCTVLCPLGFEKLLRSLGFTNIQEAGWYQQYQTPSDLKVVFLPAKHWNRRFLTDYNTTLWGSTWIESEGKSVYFAGDTALDNHFGEIKSLLGEADFCLMPVGAYRPRFVMEWAHIAPWEAVDALHQLGAKNMIPMHFGTFDLSDEPASEPLRLLESYQKEGKFLDKNLILPKVGESVFI